MHSYHHGDLRQALIDATEALLAETGPESFSLREAARRAGVSPAAPAHHFGDSSGLLTAVATQGFEGLALALREGEARGGADVRARLREQGVAYVEYALRHPGRFRLMFSHVLLRQDAELQRCGNDAFLVLENGVRAAFASKSGAPLSAEAWSAVLGLWSVVHGYAHLAIAGRLDPLECKPRGKAAATILRSVLDRVIDGCVPRPSRARRAKIGPMKRAR
jgi:AcrR family transcriptional regulator